MEPLIAPLQVSARYLDLTKKKLEVTRLPREVTVSGPQWSQGTPKAVLEPLLDYWYVTRKAILTLINTDLQQAGTV